MLDQIQSDTLFRQREAIQRPANMLFMCFFVLTAIVPRLIARALDTKVRFAGKLITLLRPV